MTFDMNIIPLEINIGTVYLHTASTSNMNKFLFTILKC